MHHQQNCSPAAINYSNYWIVLILNVKKTAKKAQKFKKANDNDEEEILFLYEIHVCISLTTLMLASCHDTEILIPYVVNKI